MVNYDPISVANNGGADILSYQLQVYDIDTSTFVTLVGGPNDFTLSTSLFFSLTSFGKEIIKGRTYVFRYRAWNVNGAGEYSDEGYLTAAQPPSTPPAPTYVYSDHTKISLTFRPPNDDGGSIINQYILQYTSISLDNWAPITSYTDNSMQTDLLISDN
jgi:titin